MGGELGKLLQTSTDHTPFISDWEVDFLECLEDLVVFYGGAAAGAAAVVHASAPQGLLFDDVCCAAL